MTGLSSGRQEKNDGPHYRRRDFKKTLRGMRRISYVGLFAFVLLTTARADSSWNAPATAANLQPPFSTDTKAIKSGRAIYEERCADCHGKSGKGNGPSASDLEKAPTNFRAGKCQSQSDGELFWKITEGRKPMPSYKKKLSEEQRWQVVHYLRTFADKP